MNIESRSVTVDASELVLYGRPDDLYFHSVCMQPGYDDHLVTIAANSLPNGGVMLDVGANIGYYAMATVLRCHRHGISGVRVHSFEPGRVNYEAFERTLSANPELASSVGLHRYGLSDHDGAARLDFSTGNTAGAHISAGMTDHYASSETIQLRRLAGALDELGIDRVDFMKVDIEGHEQVFLGAARDEIERFRPTILVEVNGWVIDVIARSATSSFVDFLLDLAPHVVGIHSDRSYIDVRKDRTTYLRANLLGKTHQDVVLAFDDAQAERALAGFHPCE